MNAKMEIASIEATENMDIVQLRDIAKIRETIRADKFEFRTGRGKIETVFIDATGDFWAMFSDGKTAFKVNAQ